MLRQILWIKKSDVRQGKEKFLHLFTWGKSRALCLADSLRSRSWRKPHSKKMKRRPEETWSYLVPVAGMEYASPRKSGDAWTNEWAAFRMHFKVEYFISITIYKTVQLGLVEMGRSMYSLKPLLFSAVWLKLQTHHWSRGENWDVSRQVKGI